MLSELQQYLRRAAARHRSVIRSGPFLVHVDATSAEPYANYAIPDDGARPTAADVAALVETFAAHERRAAFEYLPACAPGVEPLLLDAGLQVTRRIPLMTCPPERVAELAPPDGVTIALATADTSQALAREIRGVQHAAFGIPDVPVTDEDVVRLRSSEADGGVFAYASDDEEDRVVGAAMALPIDGGLTELVGIAVAEPARNRGIAGALTARVAREAVARGAHLPFLTPGDDGAGRAYARAGFATAGEMLHLATPAA